MFAVPSLADQRPAPWSPSFSARTGASEKDQDVRRGITAAVVARSSGDQNAGVTSTRLPGGTTRSSPAIHTESLSRSLHLSGLPASVAHCQVLGSTHFSGVPLSQLNPGPSPRTNSLLPKPTSIFASIVVTGFAVVTVLVCWVSKVGFTPFLPFFFVVIPGFIIIQFNFGQCGKRLTVHLPLL